MNAIKNKNFREVKDLREHQPKALGASDIVNGAASTFKIEEVEMEDAIKKILNEINEEG